MKGSQFTALIGRIANSTTVIGQVALAISAGISHLRETGDTIYLSRLIQAACKNGSIANYKVAGFITQFVPVECKSAKIKGESMKVFRLLDKDARFDYDHLSPEDCAGWAEFKNPKAIPKAAGDIVQLMADIAKMSTSSKYLPAAQTVAAGIVSAYREHTDAPLKQVG